MKNIFKIVFIIIGTIIGAGFASGQEINLFFFSYGIKGLAGIIISSIIIGIVIFKVLKIIKEYQINNYIDFLEIIINFKNYKLLKYKCENIKRVNYKYTYKNSEKFKNSIIKLINIVINSFILITFFIMIAGFGAYFEQEFKINKIYGSLALAMLNLFVFSKNIKGVIKVNEIIVPILIILLIVIGSYIIKDVNIFNFQSYKIDNNYLNWILKSILYASYNSILLIPVLITIRDYITSKKLILNVGILSGIIVSMVSIIIFFLLFKVDVDIEMLEMPAVYVVSKSSSILKIIYGFIILASIFTTSISLGISFLQNISTNKKSYIRIAIIMCITSVIISKIGFSYLISLLYPIFGYLGLLQILFLCSKIRQNSRKAKDKENSYERFLERNRKKESK